MRFHKLNILVAFTLLVCLSLKSQQIRFEGLKTDLTSNDQKVDYKNFTEIPELRNEFSSAYKSKDGKVVYVFSELPLNYKKNGQLAPIKTEPELVNGWLFAMNQPDPVKVNENGTIFINAETKNEIRLGKQVIINGIKTHEGEIHTRNENAEILNIAPNINKTFRFSFAGVKYNYEILQKPILTQNDLIIEEEIELPPGAHFVYDGEHGINSSSGWQGTIKFVDKSENEIGKLRAAVCLDQNKKYTTASYKHFQKNGKTFLQIIVPGTWVNDPSTTYPIIIDPLITGPTSTWATGLISSCLAPANHSDSIQVTIPAQITVTGLFVSGSYYADPFTTTVMADGKMWFSTNCDSSQAFTVTGSVGATAGTAYLTDFNLRSPLLCCIAQSCNTQTFYLSMHLQRTQPGTGCNTTYLYHDPLGGYPFKAYIEGHTVENSGLAWSITPNNTCSNVCNFSGTVWIKYGVPPYTATHPWMNGSLTWQTPAGCSFGTSSKVLPLTIPNCPWYCDTITQIPVPSPTVTDACGNIVSVFPNKVMQINKAPDVTTTPNTVNICSGDSFTITISSCVPGANISWSGNGNNGNGTSLVDSIFNTGNSPTQTQYVVSVSANGCTGTGDTIIVNTFPFPNADFTNSPMIKIVNETVNFLNNSSSFGDSISSWIWDFGDNSTSNLSNTTHTYTSPGSYTVCLTTISTLGCADTICKVIDIIPAEITAPNILTPNGDTLNDILTFKYLEYFPENHLKIYNRWGQMIYEKTSYQNNWNGSGLADGTYFYILEVGDSKRFSSFLQIVK